ncbi:MAG TPA: transglycosylase domain-containing protein [Clostridiales bacterium]|nr:transglycosylase domain-containing protein [Clostridiales bacterium]HQP69438.1 transglycosylase domain-containing protein [Clostridiales bacterium]
MKKYFKKTYEVLKKALKSPGYLFLFPFRMHGKRNSALKQHGFPKWKKSIIWMGWAVSVFHVLVILFGLFFSVLYSFIDPPVSSFMIYRAVFDGYEIRKNEFIPLKKLPKGTSRMLVRVEDSNFYDHWGIDIDAIESARKRNEKAGYNKYGGSTITQQLVKTLFLVPEKLLIRKYAEVIIAIEFDLILSKDRILELYLNNVEWGKGIFGIEAAAVYHYNKHAVKLNREETARLITILPNPLKYNVKNFARKKSMSRRYYRLMPSLEE